MVIVHCAGRAVRRSALRATLVRYRGMCFDEIPDLWKWVIGIGLVILAYLFKGLCDGDFADAIADRRLAWRTKRALLAEYWQVAPGRPRRKRIGRFDQWLASRRVARRGLPPSLANCEHDYRIWSVRYVNWLSR